MNNGLRSGSSLFDRHLLGVRMQESPYGTGRCVCWIDLQIDVIVVFSVIVSRHPQAIYYNKIKLRVINNSAKVINNTFFFLSFFLRFT